MNAALQQYIDLFLSQREMLERHAPAAMNAHREAALHTLRSQDLPTRRQERYKYTDIPALLRPDYGLNLQRLAANDTATSCAVPGLRTSVRYVAGDVVMPLVEQVPNEGVEVLSFHEAQTVYPELLTTHYNHLASASEDALSALNILLAQDGLLLFIKKEYSADVPIQIVYNAAMRASVMHNRRLLVVAEPDSRAKILLCDHCQSTHDTLTTQVTEVFLGEGAQVDLYGIEETNTACHRLHNVYVRQDARSSFSQIDVTLRAGLSRTMIDVVLQGTDARTKLGGAVVADGKQHIDYNMLVTHLAENCTSEMIYKSVLDDDSTAALAGKVYVAPNAQKTTSQQTFQSLCVSESARALSQPMLEIYADDVKCNHGGTVGKLDEQSLLYMRQRGISEAEARMLLQHAFVSEVVSHIDLPALRDRLHTLIDQRFRGSDEVHCAGCGLCAK